MRRSTIPPVVVAIALGATLFAPRATAPLSTPQLQRVALGQGLSGTPGCAESAPLFRSHMPRLVGWRPAGQHADQKAPQAMPEAEPEAPEAAEVQPAMHQALHLCVVEKFTPRLPFGGASNALYRL
jgi:hypothetical protein